MTATETVRLLAYVAALWPSFRLPNDPDMADMTIAAWTDQLAQFDPATTFDAVRALAAAGDPFAPTPGQIRRKLLGVPDPAEQAHRALAEVHAELRRVGWTEPPVFTDPVTPRIIEAMGGWTEVCMTTNAEAFRAHFLRLYTPAAAKVAAEQAERRPAHLVLGYANRDGDPVALEERGGR